MDIFFSHKSARTNLLSTTPHSKNRQILSIFLIVNISLWTWNVNWTYIKRPGRLLNVFCPFNLRLVSRSLDKRTYIRYLQNGIRESQKLCFRKHTILGCTRMRKDLIQCTFHVSFLHHFDMPSNVLPRSPGTFQQIFWKKQPFPAVFKNIPKFTGKHMCWSLFLINLHTSVQCY